MNKIRDFFALFSVGPIFSDDLKTRRSQAGQIINRGNRSVSNIVEPNRTLTENTTSEAKVDVTIKAPDGVVESVKTNRTRGPQNMKLGVNMMSAA